jgi:ABC-type branched-subunit amino acid transport system substrate-binding protein
MMQNSSNHKREQLILFVLVTLIFVIAIIVGGTYPSIGNTLNALGVWVAVTQTFFQDLARDILSGISGFLHKFLNLRLFALGMPQKRRKVVKMIAAGLALLLIALLLSTIGPSYIAPLCNPGILGTSCIIQIKHNEFIGLSNGVSAFDINRPDGQQKLLAVKDYNAGDIHDTLLSLQQAILMDPTDAETLSDLENLTEQHCACPLITFIVSAEVSATDTTSWRTTVQGAYVIQKEYNYTLPLPNNAKIALLFANFGNRAEAPSVTRLIGQAVRSDRQIMGVIGWPWPVNKTSGNEIQPIEQAHLPIILPTTASEDMTVRYPYAFSIASTTEEEGEVAAEYVMQKQYGHRVLVLMHTNDAYSYALVAAFSKPFNANTIVAQLQYSADETPDLSHFLNSALTKYHPDLVYIAGYASDINAFLSNPDIFTVDPSVKIMAGDTVYNLAAYPKGSYNRRLFTESAFADMYSYKNVASPQFFCDYARDFDPDVVKDGENCYKSTTYLVNRPTNDTILAYDAMLFLIQGIKNMGDQTLTPYAITQKLMAMSNGQPLQGISGCISLNSDREPVNKNVVILFVDKSGYTQIVGQKGCLLLPN